MNRNFDVFLQIERLFSVLLFFFFNDTATTEIYTLSLHDALPILGGRGGLARADGPDWFVGEDEDRKSTRLNSSHLGISYAVFCLKKKKKHTALEKRRDKIGEMIKVEHRNVLE